MVHADDKAGADSGDARRRASRTASSPPRASMTCSRRGPTRRSTRACSWDVELITTLLRAGVNVYTGIGGYYLPGSPEFDVIDAAGRAGQRVVHRRRQHPRAHQRRVPAVRHRLHGTHPPDPRAAGATTCRRTRRARRSSRSASARTSPPTPRCAEMFDVGFAARDPPVGEHGRRRPRHRVHRLRARRRSASSLAEDDIMLPALGAAWSRQGHGRRHRVDVGGDRRATASSCGSPTSRPLRSALGPGWRADPRGSAVAGRDRRRTVDRHDVRLADGRATGSRRRCSTCRGR